MTNTPEQPLISAQNLLSDPTNLDLDKLSGHLSIAAVEADALRALISLYEDELRRELRAKVDPPDLSPRVPIPNLPSP